MAKMNNEERNKIMKERKWKAKENINENIENNQIIRRNI